MPDTVIDTAAGFPSAAAIKNAGHKGLLAYVSPSRPGTNFAGKPITREIADGYRAAGVEIAAVWQYGKPGDSLTPSDWNTGYYGGRRMAREALERARAAGMPGWCPVYFAVDENITLQQWNDVASHFFRGCGDEIGAEWVGIYGSSRVCAWALEDGVVDPRWVWVTRAWSDDDGRGYAALYQRVIDTASNPGPKVGGITVDVNDVYRADWGQWSIARSDDNPAPPAPSNPGDGPVDYGVTQTIPAGTDGRRDHDDFVAIHTQEGGNGDAPGLARFCQGGGVSYNFAVDDVETVQMVDPANAPWAAVAANDFGVHICLAGSYVAWSESRWLSSDASDGLDENAMLWRAARATAAACQQFGIPAVYVGDGGAAGWPKARGICGHKDFGARGGGHTDPYPNFPWAIFVQRVQSFLAPVVNLIEQEAEVAKAWIGKRLAEPGEKGETKIIVGGREIGRFVEYEAGHIYWREGANFAFAVPHDGLFEAWAARGWEQGECGFPVLHHEVFAWGANQSFDGGVLFVVTGSDPRGFLVHGEIGKRYAAMDWEKGPLGLPVSDEQPVAGTDNITQIFEKGRLTWSPTGVIVEMEK